MRKAAYWLLALAPLCGAGACTCRTPHQENRPMETQNPLEQRKPADFPAEKIAKPMDLEKGEGVPQKMQDAVEKGLEQAKKGKKTQ